MTKVTLFICVACGDALFGRASQDSITCGCGSLTITGYRNAWGIYTEEDFEIPASWETLEKDYLEGGFEWGIIPKYSVEEDSLKNDD